MGRVKEMMMDWDFGIMHTSDKDKYVCTKHFIATPSNTLNSSSTFLRYSIVSLHVFVISCFERMIGTMSRNFSMASVSCSNFL